MKRDEKISKKMIEVRVLVDGLRNSNELMNEKLTLVDRMLKISESTPGPTKGAGYSACPLSELEELINDVE